MPDRISELRRQNQFEAAVDLLINFFQDSRAAQQPDRVRSLLGKHIVRECLVLDWAAQRFAEGWRSKCGRTLDLLANHVAPWMGPHRAQFESRLALIRLASVGQDTEDCRAAVEQCARTLAQAWNYQPFEPIAALQASEAYFQPTPDDSRHGPLYLWDLDHGYRRMLHELAREFGWLHPGLLLAGETLAVLEGVSPPSDHRVSGRLLFAFDHGDCFGVLAPLQIERIPGGRGWMVPDARRAAYLRMKTCFSTAWQHAWYAAWITRGSQPTCDFRWSIDLFEGVRGTVLQSTLGIPLEGCSGEGLLTCALRSAARGHDLDRNTSMSACLELPIERSLALQPVGSLDVKCLSPRYLGNAESFRKALRKRHIHRILVSDRQPQEDYDTGSGHDFLPVRSIVEAEAEFQLWPAITRTVKQYLAERAEQHRITLCGAEPPTAEELQQLGCSYVQSPISYRPLRRTEQEEKLVPLDQDEIRRFVLGRWRPNAAASDASIRIRLFADSGMGKSVQLVVCEQQIAARRDAMIPIRIGKAGTHRVRQEQLPGSTSVQTIDWRQRDQEVLVSLARQCLGRAIPDDYSAHVNFWIEWKAKAGEIVFLIDALDQTAGDLESLAKFLAQYPQCPVIAAGRPESVNTRGSLFGQQEWWTLDLQPLGRDEQRRFLGEDLAGELLLGDDDHDEVNSFTNVEVVRKHMWQALLPIPLLLQMMKRLVRGDGIYSLRQINNRYQLYGRAVDELLKKGLESQGKSRSLSSRVELRRQMLRLQQLALYMTRQHNFDALEGDPFEKWQTQCEDSALDDLVQVDLITMHGLLDRITFARNMDWDRDEPGIEWRHRSFQEYFAGLELARLWTSEYVEDQQTVRDVLQDVHHVLDANGVLRTWHVFNHETRKSEVTFRDLPTEWNWVLRFMLSSLSGVWLDRMVALLTELGNPWVVYHALQRDEKSGSSELEDVARWLVHRDFSTTFDFTGALERGDQQVSRESAADAFRRSGVDVSKMLDRSTRDASWLSPLRELVGDDVIHQHVSQESSLLDRMQSLRGGPAESPKWNFLESFVRIQEGRFDISRYSFHELFLPRSLPKLYDIRDFELADFPVTNELFELFCPTHRRWRDRRSDQDDQPALYVSWYMADEFCEWLSALAGRTYRLPSEWEWEWACRWLGDEANSPHAHDDYWWGPDMDDSLCWHGRGIGDDPAKSAGRTRGRREAIAAFRDARVQHPSWVSPSQPGLLDLAGNVSELCVNFYDDKNESSRSLRGGSWYMTRDSCNSSCRRLGGLYYRLYDIGFRLCRE